MENTTNNKHKPNFTRYNSEYLKKLDSNWRSPRGIHNKVRLKRKGHPRSPSIGYGSPKEEYGLYKSKFSYKIINSENDLLNLDEEYVILSGRLGIKNKLNIINKLKASNVKILNLKDPEKFIKDVEEKLKQKKDKRKKHGQEKQELKKKIEEKAVQKEKKELTIDEKIEKEKLDKKKLLEKPQ